MMRQSAGLLMYRRRAGGLEVFLVHPGGPFWAKKDAGAWSIPKGEPMVGEELVTAARREFEEETGFAVVGSLLELGAVQQKGGKVVHAWAFEGDCDAAAMVSNRCEIEWPPRSGRRLEIAEVDRGEWFGVEEAGTRMVAGQVPLLERLAERLRAVAPADQGGLPRKM